MGVKRHAPHGAIEHRNSNVQNALRATRLSSDLERPEPHPHGWVGAVVEGRTPWRWLDKVADEGTNRAHVDVFEPMESIYVDRDC